ncbi:helix-turn-helix domain-containing protein [Roseomonas sp. SSH11]|uniref:Helix-turn-helix domain-containing protein n=1 Tax=Pararoseomonas baculiformis TaxID=2820812 RepID=A0ABS4AEP3_9PROT|nr:helix-turn-helix domain-containing protein [Pararoseomonas baculiformis]MBP0445475.1 helix-turn-helix domain-containing protein [Pararoseomonas baculiformis]
MDFPVSPAPASPPPEPGFPSFDLYGEAEPRARLEPVHLEALATRSSRHDWSIRPHRHRDLWQFFWIRRGGGTLLGEGPERRFTAPVLHVIPAGTVHGFRYHPSSDGHVLTVAAGFLGQCDRLAGGAQTPPMLTSLAPAVGEGLVEEVNDAFARMEAAFQGFGPERDAALAGHVLLLLALLRRGRDAEAEAATTQAALIRRFREEIERHFRDHSDLDAHCARLGVSRSTLTRACRAVTGRSPLDLVHERVMAEARRLLIHGARNVSGVAYALGFEPAYFSRFFRRREGISPARYQRQHSG